MINKKIILALLALFILSLGLSILITKRPVQKTAEIYQEEAPALVTSGNYLIKLKGFSHRQILFCKDKQTQDDRCKVNESIPIALGENTLDLTGHPLEFGDANLDGNVGVNDYSFVKGCKDQDARKAVNNYNGCGQADANLDGVVDSTDIDLLYKTLSSKPDDE